MRALDCAVVRDLMPLYAEGLVEERTKREIEAHLDICEECRKQYATMKKEIFIRPKPAATDRHLLLYLKLHKLWYLLCPLAALILLSVGWAPAWEIYRGVLLVVSAVCVASQFFSAASFGFDMEQYWLQKEAEDRSKKKWGKFRLSPLGWCVPCVLTVAAVELPRLLLLLLAA